MKITGQQSPEFHGVKGGTAKDSQKTAERSGLISGTSEPPVKTSTFVMNKIKDRISTEPEVRADRVAELKDKIKNGEYQLMRNVLPKQCWRMLFRKI